MKISIKICVNCWWNCLVNRLFKINKGKCIHHRKVCAFGRCFVTKKKPTAFCWMANEKNVNLYRKNVNREASLIGCFCCCSTFTTDVFLHNFYHVWRNDMQSHSMWLCHLRQLPNIKIQCSRSENGQKYMLKIKYGNFWVEI